MTYNFASDRRKLAYCADWRTGLEEVSLDIRWRKADLRNNKGGDKFAEQRQLHYLRVRANKLMLEAAKIESGVELELNLTTIEFNLLNTFVSQPHRVWNRTQLIDRLWGDDFYGDERVVDTHVARLRKKIEPDPTHPQFIKTVLGVGYKFEDDKAE